jgi:hypothetical protein
MKAVTETISALGTPIVMQAVGEGPSPAAMIARWRHGESEVNVAASDTTLVAVSLQDGQRVKQQVGQEVVSRTIRAGSVLVVPRTSQSK